MLNPSREVHTLEKVWDSLFVLSNSIHLKAITTVGDTCRYESCERKGFFKVLR